MEVEGVNFLTAYTRMAMVIAKELKLLFSLT